MNIRTTPSSLDWAPKSMALPFALDYLRRLGVPEHAGTGWDTPRFGIGVVKIIIKPTEFSRTTDHVRAARRFPS